MRIIRILADPGGISRFATHEVPTETIGLFQEMPAFRVTRFAGPLPVKLFAVPAELDVADWHTAPMRQLGVALNGTVEYDTGDGEVRRFAAGEQRFLQIPVPDDWPGPAAG